MVRKTVRSHFDLAGTTLTSEIEKLADLETRLTFQEDLIESLNKQVAQQQQEINTLQIQLQHLNRKFKSLADDLESQHSADDQPPPHY